ncbi:hypothetical protein B7486_46870 [cyanobacterium TDX16]|nr:hypothetical protein B7486_46870 [cyanobacterium TDX16]
MNRDVYRNDLVVVAFGVTTFLTGLQHSLVTDASLALAEDSSYLCYFQRPDGSVENLTDLCGVKPRSRSSIPSTPLPSTEKSTFHPPVDGRGTTMPPITTPDRSAEDADISDPPQINTFGESAEEGEDTQMDLQ